MSLLSITIQSMLDLVKHTPSPHMLGRITFVIIRLHFILFSIGLISLLTNLGYHYQDPIILVFSIHNFRECMAGIFSIVMADDIICDSGILDIVPPSMHEIQEFSLCDPLHVPHKIFFQIVLYNNFYRVIFTTNILVPISLYSTMSLRKL